MIINKVFLKSQFLKDLLIDRYFVFNFLKFKGLLVSIDFQIYLL